MTFTDKLDHVDEAQDSIHDPIIKIKLSDLARIQSDAEFHADSHYQYRAIRNRLVAQRKELQALLEHRADEAAKLREEIRELKNNNKESENV